MQQNGKYAHSSFSSLVQSLLPEDTRLRTYLWYWVWLYVRIQRGAGGPDSPGGGTLIFPAYVGSGPASTVNPKKINRTFKHAKNIF